MADSLIEAKSRRKSPSGGLILLASSAKDQDGGSAVRLLTLRVVLICAVLVPSACSSGGLVSAYNPQEDAKKLQGSWKVTGTTFNGQRMSVEDIGNTHLTISGDQYTMAHNGGKETSTFTLGGGGPRTIRVFHHENPLASQGFYGGTLTGIYELSGDRLRICFDVTGREYPRSFDAGRGSRRGIYELIREK